MPIFFCLYTDIVRQDILCLYNMSKTYKYIYNQTFLTETLYNYPSSSSKVVEMGVHSEQYSSTGRQACGPETLVGASIGVLGDTFFSGYKFFTDLASYLRMYSLLQADANMSTHRIRATSTLTISESVTSYSVCLFIFVYLFVCLFIFADISSDYLKFGSLDYICL